jgi:hypothetical protein
MMSHDLLAADDRSRATRVFYVFSRVFMGRLVMI